MVFLPCRSPRSHRLGSRLMIKASRFSAVILAFFAGFSPALLVAQSSEAPFSDSQAKVDTSPAIVTPISTVVSFPTVVESSPNTQSAVQLPEVVVTANRLETPASQVPNSLTVITAQDMERKQSETVMDALQNVPGMAVAQSGGPGEIASLYTRGTRDGDTLVLMDGIPLNDPLGTSRSYDYLDELTLGGIQRIEVLRGPESVLFGSNAMAGVINIIPREGSGPTSGSVLAEGGSYGTTRESASVQGGNSKCDYALSTSYFSTAGFPSADKAFGNSLNNPYSDFSGLLKVGAPLASNIREEILLNYNQSSLNTDDGAGSAAGDPVMDDPFSWANQKQVLLGSKTRWTLGNWEQDLILSFVDDNRSNTDVASPVAPNAIYGDSQYLYDGQTAQITWQNDLKIMPEETIVLGLQGYREWGNSSSISNSSYGSSYNAPTLNSQWEESGFLESQTNLEERFFLNLGERVDNYNTYGTHDTYQFGAAYFIPELDTKLKATYGTGFTAPTLYQLYAPANSGATINQGNLNLQPETSTGYDLGLEQPLGKSFATLGATYFHTQFDNLIASVGGYPNSQYQNSSNFQTQGVETFLNFNGVQGLVVQASYTYTEIQTDVPATSDASPLLKKPTDQAGLDVDYHSGAVEAGYSGLTWGRGRMWIFMDITFLRTTYRPRSPSAIISWSMFGRLTRSIPNQVICSGGQPFQPVLRGSLRLRNAGIIRVHWDQSFLLIIGWGWADLMVFRLSPLYFQPSLIHDFQHHGVKSQGG